MAVINPATGKTIGRHAHAKQADLDAALEAADAGFKRRQIIAMKRAAILKKAAAFINPASK